jgi:hypothetical protein
VAVFGGRTHQKTNAKWAKRRNMIDRVFWFTPNHCASAWAAEVEAAKKTLLKAGI